jgi:leucyl/phenylalanyl-tRNA--protein transferase
MSTQRIVWLSPGDPADRFPAIETALIEPNGLLAAGGDLGSERLLSAYRSGIFPWYDSGQPILWWSPDPRCVLCPDQLRVSRRLRQYARRSELSVGFNQAFGDVIRACAGHRDYSQGTWITAEMISAYEKLHTTGWAHSVEIWDQDKLVGGLYGVCIGRVFFGESMFSIADNASKFAMLGLTAQMLLHGLELMDCQVTSPHLLTMGAVVVPRNRFKQQLTSLCHPPSRFTNWPTARRPVPQLLDDWRSAALH